MPLGDGGYRIQIRDVQRGVADGLHVQGARPPVDGGFHLVKILRLHEACSDPELGQDIVEQGERSAVQVVRRDDFVPLLRQIDDRRKNGGRTRRRSQRPDTALQQAHTFFQHGLRGVAEPPVDIPLFGKAKKQPSAKAIHLLSFFITLLGVVLVLVLALTLLIPELVQSFHSLYVQIEANIPRWTAYLNAQDADMGWLMNWLEGINWEQLLHKVTASIDTVLVNAVGAVSATVNIAITASFALIISVYMSLSTESLGHQARTLVCAYLKPAHAAGVLKFCRLFRQSFANFLTGQCSEAVILGVLMALAFSVFKIPYGSLVGVLTAICAIIPYVGALISCVVSVFLVLLVDPVLAVRCLIVYLAVQFVENQFIYPRVVGKSVGLSPLYTLIAAMIGGKLFGIIGIIFFIPLTAVVIELVKEDTFRRLRAKEPLQ